MLEAFFRREVLLFTLHTLLFTVPCLSQGHLGELALAHLVHGGARLY